MSKRSDFAHIIDGKGVRGMILGFDEDRFFRLHEPIHGVRDFKFYTCDVSVTLEDNTLCIPKDPSKRPFLDIMCFDEDPKVRIPAPEGVMERLRDRRNMYIKCRPYLRGDVYDAIKAKADKVNMDVEKYLTRLAELDVLSER